MDLESQFLRYRDAGDADALGRVFDRAAPTLLRIARHVAGARETAPDLVQATFLTAIEKASAYDPARPLLPWLTGILVRHAAWARRRSGRTPDPERVDLPLPRDPADLVSERELEGEVERALRALPERYRPLVEARLRDEARGVDLARRSGRSPGVVRMQLHRGLERLRRALPASLLPSLAFLLGSRRALAAARAEVLARAGAPGSAAAAPVPALVGGTLVANKTILTGGAVLAAGAAWLLSLDGGPLPVPAATPPVTVDAERATATFPVVAPARVPAAATVAAPLPVDAPTEEGGAPFPASYVASLTGVTGRLVEPDGAPVPATPIALVEARPGELVAEVGFAFGEAGAAPRLEAARASTGADGRFTLAGAHARGVHALSIDPAGARATLRLLDVALRPGAVTDLGDVVLAAGVRLTGRIVDEDDRPIEGARVRVAAVPFPVALFGAEHWREGARIVRLHRDPADHAVFAPPAWIEAQTRRLPIASARTDADGRFVVERAPRGVLTLAVDATDRPAHVFPPVPSGDGATRDAGTLVLPPGRAVAGVVRDAAGAPVAGATVIGGVLPPAGRVVIAPHEVVTDVDGRFTLAPLPEDGAVVAAARRAPGERFACVGPTDDAEISIALPPTGALAVTLRDADGATVPDVEARLRPSLDLDELSDHVVGADAAPEARRDGDRLVFDAVPIGAYRLLARSPSTGLVTRPVDVREGTTELDVRIGTPRTLDVRVIDLRTGRPVEHARLTLFASTERPALLAARTDADGRARLGPTPVDRDRWTVRAEHPAYAAAYMEVDPEVETVDLTLDGGGALAARFSARGNPPAAPVTLHLRLDPYAGDDRHVLDEELPWFATSDARGDLHVPNLPAGRYRYEVRPTRSPGDGLAALAALAPTGRPLRRGTLEIAAGETTELRVELADDDGPPARVRGRLTLDGAPVAARLQMLVVDAAGETTSRSAVAGDDGRFAIADLPAGAGRLVGSFEDGPSTGVAFEERFELAPGDERVVDVALRTHAVPVRVTKDGRPVAGAQVWGKDGTRSQWAETDARGIAPLRTFAAGSLRLRAAHDLGIAHAEVEVPDGGLAAPREMALEDGVPFAGTFTLDHALAAARGPLVLRVTFYDGNLFASRSIPLDDGARSFRVLGFDPGTFWVELRVGRAESERIEFALDASGSETLSFDFEAD